MLSVQESEIDEVLNELDNACNNNEKLSNKHNQLGTKKQSDCLHKVKARENYQDVQTSTCDAPFDCKDLCISEVELDEVIANVNIGQDENAGSISSTFKNHILSILPQGFSYVIKNITPVLSDSCMGFCQLFTASVISDIKSQADILLFIKKYEKLTKETLRRIKNKKLIDKSHDNFENHQFILKECYQCHHNTCSGNTQWAPGKRHKNTKCPFAIIFKLHNEAYKNKRPEKTLFDTEYPCEVNIFYVHNHNTTPLQVLSFRDIEEDTISKMYSLFQDPCTPSIAYSRFKKDLRSQSKDDLI